MKKLLIVALASATLLPVSAMANGSHGGGHHMENMKMNMNGMNMQGMDHSKMGMMNGMDHSKMNMKMDMNEKTVTKDEAPKVLEKSLVVMGKTVSDKYFKEMFDNGPIMDEWHETMMDISDATDALYDYAEKLGGAKQAKIEAAIENFTDTLDEFHNETHERSVEGARKEVANAHKALNKIKNAIK